MKTGLKTLTFSMVASLLTISTSFASLPEGSFKGKSSFMGRFNNDVMALLVKKDQHVEDRYYAVLAEYDRIPLTNFTRKTAITKWVPRIYAYRIDKVDDLKYSMSPLYVTSSGEIEVREDVKADLLTLQNADTFKGAVISKYSKDSTSEEIEETITMKGRVGSTWEEYVPGTYYGTNRKTGMDYFKKTINSELTEDGVAKFGTKEIQGDFTMTEKVPGFFSFQKYGNVVKGEEVVKKIGVFIDIVNWKPLMTTDELLIINPDDAYDVGFFYERH